MAYKVEFAESVKAHLAALTAGERSAILLAIERQLQYEPLVETRNRKPLRPNPMAPWGLRVGRLRVFYEMGLGDPRVVRVLAVGRKLGNTLWIGGQEIKL